MLRNSGAEILASTESGFKFCLGRSQAATGPRRDELGVLLGEGGFMLPTSRGCVKITAKMHRRAVGRVSAPSRCSGAICFDSS